MSTPEAGWYDDPWSPDQYRYWDGHAWTPHAAPKHAPPAPPQTPQWGEPHRPSPGYPGPPGYSGYPGGPEAWRPTFGPTTPDGVPLSGWWRRAGARILDQLIVNVLSLPFAGYFWYQASGEFGDYFDRVMDSNNNGGASTSVPVELQVHVLVAFLITLVIAVGYEATLLRRSGATWGKRATGIRVRPRDAEVQLDWATIAKRIGFMQGLGLLSLIPVIGIAAGIAGMLDYLWPLWDPNNQALHDKVAATNVVKTG